MLLLRGRNPDGKPSKKSSKGAGGTSRKISDLGTFQTFFLRFCFGYNATQLLLLLIYA